MAKLLTVDELSDALNRIDGMDPGTEQQAAALDAVIQHVAALSSQLARAHAAISVLYVGRTARDLDGKVNVEAVIRACLGEPS
jgi:hypothetical protein